MFERGEKMDRVILHSDMNAFYASVETLERPELKRVPMAVGGSPESRHGVILAKNQLAKEYGVRTGEPLWQARMKCRDLVVVPPHFRKYQLFSKRAREIYLQYTDLFEPYGIDEGWLDVTASRGLFGSGETIAREINTRIKKELGLTVSVGVSWNKIFAKLGSDYRKPDAVTVFDRQSYHPLICPLPVRALLYVGDSTARKLESHGIRTIGQLAAADSLLLENLLGKWGCILQDYALGNDHSPVSRYDEKREIKSISNSTTTLRDLRNEEEVKMIFTVLADSVARRLRKHGFCGQTVRIQIRDTDFHTVSRQCRLDTPTCFSGEVARVAMSLFRKNYHWAKPIRLLGIGVSDLLPQEEVCIQEELFLPRKTWEKQQHLAEALDEICRRYGNSAIQSGCLLVDRELVAFQPKEETAENEE